MRIRAGLKNYYQLVEHASSFAFSLNKPDSCEVCLRKLVTYNMHLGVAHLSELRIFLTLELLPDVQFWWFLKLKAFLLQ